MRWPELIAEKRLVQFVQRAVTFDLAGRDVTMLNSKTLA